jgi:hypothetical protein
MIASGSAPVPQRPKTERKNQTLDPEPARRDITITRVTSQRQSTHWAKARPTPYPRSILRYGLLVGSGITVRVMQWCCWGGLNSRPRHYQSKGSTAGTPSIATILGDGRVTFALDPRQTQTVRSSGFGVFLLKVLWSNKIAKCDLPRTYRPAGMKIQQGRIDTADCFSNCTTDGNLTELRTAHTWF